MCKEKKNHIDKEGHVTHFIYLLNLMMRSWTRRLIYDDGDGRVYFCSNFLHSTDFKLVYDYSLICESLECRETENSRLYRGYDRFTDYTVQSEENTARFFLECGMLIAIIE